MEWQWFEFYKGALINLLDFNFIVSLLGALFCGFDFTLNDHSFKLYIGTLI
jgi:hypothetical protein